jgi:hypothetical protein
MSMSELMWVVVRYDLPVTLVLLAGLILVVVRRRHLGRAAGPAIQGCIVLLVAIAAREAWALFQIHFLIVATDEQIRQAKLLEQLDPAARMVVLLIYLVGLYLLINALFAGRRRATGAER